MLMQLTMIPFLMPHFNNNNNNNNNNNKCRCGAKVDARHATPWSAERHRAEFPGTMP